MLPIWVTIIIKQQKEEEEERKKETSVSEGDRRE
jgi:hypothetical protein